MYNIVLSIFNSFISYLFAGGIFMKKNFIILLLIFTCLFAFAELRTALVIGNGDYEVSPLRNTENDATDMAASLEDFGKNPKCCRQCNNILNST